MKKFLATIFAICILLSVLAIPCAAETKHFLGDVNCDGNLSPIDYILAKRGYFGSFSLDKQGLENADINCNDKLEPLDYALLKRMYFGTYDVPKDQVSDNYDPSNVNWYQTEAEALRLINEYRNKAGVEPLTANKEIYSCAKVRAEEASVNWSHTRPDGTDFYTVFDMVGFDYRRYAVGENLAMGFKDVKGAIDGLMNSEGHRRNILNPNYSSVAIGIYKANDGKYYMAQLFVG